MEKTDVKLTDISVGIMNASTVHPALRTPAYRRTPRYKGQLFFSQAFHFL